MRTLAAFVVLTSCFVAPAPCDGEDWKPAEGPLLTGWAKEVSPESVHPEYLWASALSL